MYNLFLDLETNGLPEFPSFGKFYDYKDLNRYNNSRILSICIYLIDENEKVIDKMYHILKANDFEVKNEQIHGITQQLVLKEGVEWITLIDRIESLFKKSKLLIGHNIDFDRYVLSSELYRKGYKSLAELIFNQPTFCTMKNGKSVTKINNGFADYKYPKLSELYTYLFKEQIQGAHNAEYDVINCAKCYYKMI